MALVIRRQTDKAGGLELIHVESLTCKFHGMLFGAPFPCGC